MIQIFADGAMVYDSRLEDYDLAGLKTTRGLNKGGTAEITMPANHPAYNSFTGYKTIVEVYRDNRLRFRGRALYPLDDFDRRRTVVCEGELCFFQDGISRPYLYQDTPKGIFSAVVADYNSQVEPFKRFRLGTVTVTDPNDYVRLESESAETCLATIKKLLERCGGYIVFTTAADGARVINWLASVGRRSGQTIELGENLFDFSRSGANTDLATALVPYGAKDEATGRRVTIESVNSGRDYIVDEAAAAIRGTIFKTATWDDVTEPANLLRKARQYLDECKLIVTSLELTALDLSYVDKTVDSFEEGDWVRVVSKAHGLDEDFQIADLAENHLDPTDGLLKMGKELRSLTSQDVSGDKKAQSDLEKAAQSIKKDYEINIKQVAAEVGEQMSSGIKQASDAILLEVSKTYLNKDALTGYATEEHVKSSIETFAGGITLKTSGSLGGTASIKLTVNGTTTTETLDLTKVRQAFAGDTSAVEIKAGTVTFSSDTLIINSTNLQVSADGTITAKNAELSGTLTTESGLYKSRLNSGMLRFYYDGTELGNFTSAWYASDASKRGLAIHLKQDAAYIAFGCDTDGNGEYTWDYIINHGLNSSDKTERHLFYGTARFANRIYCSSGLALSNTHGLRVIDTAGAEQIALRMLNTDRLTVGCADYPLDLVGSEVTLGRAGYPTNIYGTTNLYGEVSCSGITFPNGYGIRIKDTAGTANYVLSFNSSDQCFVGVSAYKTYLRGTAVYLQASGATVTSDARRNNSIEPLPDAYEAVLDHLTPVRYKYNDGTSGRYHAGFTAQAVKEALEAAGLTTQDFGGYIDLNGDGEELGLIYTEFIALLLHKIQSQERRIVALEKERTA